MGTVEKRDKHKKRRFVSPEEKLERELKDCMRKYYELGYEVEDCPPPAGYKDYNEWLVAAKLNLNRMNKRADEPVRA